MKPKQARKEPSERTRNLRHGPTLDRDKAAAAAATETDGKARVNAQVAALALRTASSSHAHAGIAKSKSKKLSSKQRRRREQMVERGSAFTEKLVQKAVEFEESQKNVKQRAADWEQINDKAMAELLESDERVAKIAPV